MKNRRKNIGDKQVMPFTIPSGIITTQVSTIKRFLKIIPELGIITTKTITLEKCEGNREPILAKIYLNYDTPNLPLGFINAVGLENPGVDKFIEMIKNVSIPNDKFLLVSIAGRNIEEFVQIAKSLEEYVDGIELNLSCPTKKGFGKELIKNDLEGKNFIVYEITKHVAKNFRKPIFVKLGYERIEYFAEQAIRAGAYGISAINTIGNYIEELDGHHILSNKYGGISGNIIKHLALEAIYKIRMKLGNNFKIIGMGGIRNASDIISFERAGADFFGIGSALEGLKESEIRKYFLLLVFDLENGKNYAESLLKNVDMRYRKAKILEKIKASKDLVVLSFDISIHAKPGQFVFLCIPDVGEKPFSVVDNEPLKLAILKRGLVTTKIVEDLEVGDEVYIRGPYGSYIDLKEIDISKEATIVAGGVGIAGIYLLAKELSKNSIDVTLLLGARDKDHLILLEKLKEFGDVFVATEDGSIGYKGLITQLFDEIKSCIRKGCYFFNCGKKEMIEALLPKELEISPKERIYLSFDHITRCGIGICGRCANEKGLRTCVEGPFMKMIDEYENDRIT